MLSEVKKCADSGDIKGLKYIFVDCLDVDPTFEKYIEEWEYCKNVPGFVEPNKELTAFCKDISAWDDDYWAKLKSDLMKNFSVERFDHMRQVAKVIYADKIKRLLAERTEKATASKRAEEERMQHEREDLERENAQKLEQQRQEKARKEAEQAEKRRIEILRQQGLQRAAEERSRKEAEEKAISEKTEQEKQSKKALGAVLIVAAVVIVVIVILVIK